MSRIYIYVGAVIALAASVGLVLYHRREGEGVEGSDPDAPADDLPTLSTTDTGEPSAADLEGLARALASEAPHGQYTDAERVAIGWCAINWANHRHRTIEAIMMPPHHQKGFWCSTFQSPSEADTALSTILLNGGEYSDPTGGAISFFEPKVQDAAVKTGAAGITKTAQQIRDKWSSEGLHLTVVIGRWEFYAKG